MTDPEKKLLTPDRPYPGLSSFEEAHEAYFFGRSREIAELIELIGGCPLGVLYAKAGFGKTSLLQAGVFRHLRAAGLVPVRVRFRFGDDPDGRPSPPLARQVLDHVGAAVRDGSLDARPPREGESLWDYCHSSTFWTPEGTPATPVIVLDQFEEVFTLGAARRAELESLAEEIRYLVEGRIPAQSRARVGAGEIDLARVQRDTPPVHVLISLREDFLGDLVALRPKLGSLDLAAGAMHLGPLSYDAAIEAVWRPAQPKKLVDRDVAELIVQRAAGLDAAPPAPLRASVEVEAAILALFCDKLNERRIPEGRKAIDADLVRGSAGTILQEFYDERTAPDQVSATLRPILEEELLTPDGRRDMRAEAILVQRGADPAELRRLVDRRLLRKEERLGQPYYEIIHDVLTGVIEQSRAKRRAAEAQARAQAKADEDERRRQEEEKAALRRRAEEEQRKAAEERAKLAEELAAAKKREAEVAEEKRREAEEKARLAEELAAAQRREAEVAEEKRKAAEELAAAQKREADLVEERRRDAAERRRRRLVGLAVLGAGLLLGGGYYVRQMLVAASDAEKELRRRDTAQALSDERKLAATMTDQAARAMNGERWTDATRFLLRANESVRKAGELERKLREMKAPEPEGSAADVRVSLSLLSDRALAFTAGGRALMEDRLGLQGFWISAGGSRAAVLSRDRRTVHTIDLAAGGPPKKMASPGEEPKGKAPDALEKAAERIDWFSGDLRELVLSGDGKRLFGLGDKGAIVIWDADSGQRLSGFRTQIPDPRIQVDHPGEHALCEDVVERKAVVVKLDVAAGTVVGTGLFQQGPQPAGPAPVGSTQVLREVHLLPTGGDVVASWALPGESAQPDKGRIDQWSSNGELVRAMDLPAPVQSLLVSAAPGSPGPRFLVTGAPNDVLQLWAPAERTFSKAETIDARPQWLTGAGGAVIAVDEQGMKGWAVSESTPGGQALSVKLLFDVYLGEAARAAALSSDGARVAAMTYTGEIRLHDGKTGQPLSTVVPPSPESLSAQGWSPFADTDEALAESVRLLPDARGAVAVSEGIVRLVPLGSAEPADRFLSGGKAPRKATVSFSLPQGLRALVVRPHGSRVLVSDRRGVWVSRTVDAPREPTGAPLFSAWKKPAVDLVDAAIWDGGKECHVVALGRDGVVHFGDASGVKVSQPAASVSGAALSRWLVRMSPDGQWAATGGVGTRIHVWELASRKPAWTIDVRKQSNSQSAGSSTLDVTALAVLPGSLAPVVVAGERKGGLRAYRGGGRNNDVWSSASFEGSPHGDRITVLGTGASIAGASYKIASGAADGTTAVWTVDGGVWTSATKAPSGQRGPTHSGPVSAIRVLENVESKSGGGTTRRDLVISASSEVLVWDAGTGQIVCPMRLHSADVVAVEALGGASDEVMTRDRDGTAILWNASTCRPLVPRFQGVIHAGFAQGSPGQFMTVSPRDGVELWSQTTFSAGGDTPEGAVVWGTHAPGGALIAADDRGRVFEWRKGTPARMEGDFHGAAMVAAAPDRTAVLASSGKLCTWETAKPGSCDDALPVIEGWSMRAAALSSDGAKLFVVEEKGAALRGRTFAWGTWEQETAQPFERGDGCGSAGPDAGLSGSQAVTVVRRGAGFRVIAVEPGGCVRVWDGQGKPLLESAGPRPDVSRGPTVAVAAAPSGDRLLLASEGGVVSVWEIVSRATSGAELRFLSQDRTQHSRSVRAIAFHPNGRFAVTAGDDGDAWLWDVAETRPLVRLGVHGAPIHWAAFDTKGDRVVTGGAEGWIRSWSTRTDRDPATVIPDLEKWLPAPSGASSPP